MKKTRRASVPVSKKPTGAKASKKTRARNASVSVGKKQSGRRTVSSAGGRSKSVENKMKRSNKTSSKTSHKMSKKTAPKKKFRCTFCDLYHLQQTALVHKLLASVVLHFVGCAS